MREAGVTVPRLVDLKLQLQRGEIADFTCPALTDAGQCSIYEKRPMICRIYYADKDRPCPHGCRPIEPAKYMTYAEARALLDQALKLGTAQRPMGADAIETRLQNPTLVARLRKLEERRIHWSFRYPIEW
jgi:hypothetical protein